MKDRMPYISIPLPLTLSPYNNICSFKLVCNNIQIKGFGGLNLSGHPYGSYHGLLLGIQQPP
jgi:hypothetical protein